MRKRIIIIVVVFVTLLFIDLANPHGLLKPVIKDNEEVVKSEISSIEDLVCGQVVRVIDGDTFIADINNKQSRIRLIGVDTPESVSAENNTPEGVIASDFTKSLLEDQTVYIEYGEDSTDDYGRVLAYVYLSDGEMVQDILLSEGMARIMTVQPNSKYASHFLKIQKEAQKNEKGFWTGLYK